MIFKYLFVVAAFLSFSSFSYAEEKEDTALISKEETADIQILEKPDDMMQILAKCSCEDKKGKKDKK